MSVSHEREIAALEHDIGVRRGFFLELLDQGDDWSFVIKMHALIEAAVSHLLAEVTGQRPLLDLFARLDLSDRRFGKLAFAKALDCMEGDERRTVRHLSELRNRLVHDVSNVDFSLTAWAAALDKNKLVSAANAFGAMQTIEVEGQQVPYTTFFADNPRVCIWFSCLFLLSFIYQRKSIASLRRGLAQERGELAEQIIASRRFFVTPPPPVSSGGSGAP